MREVPEQAGVHGVNCARFVGRFARAARGIEMGDHARPRMRTAMVAVVIGNVLEWYDFIVYSFLATVIAANFFAPDDKTAALLGSFEVFGIGFLARPVGAVVLGWVGDRMGRRVSLILTILLMAAGTVAIGLIPPYAAIGGLAPALLVLARLVQGFSVGGEWGNSIAYIVESAPQGQRGFYSSLQQCSLVAGLLLGSGTAALLNTLLAPTALESWGWRIPFLIGGLIGPVGFYMRRDLNESAAYARVQRAPAGGEPGVGLAVLPIAQGSGFMILWA